MADKCNMCGEENTEVFTFDYKGTTFTEKLMDAATLDQLTVGICQSCISKIFRSLSKDK